MATARISRYSNIDAVDLDIIRGGRDVYLWGASIVGYGICRTLERCGCPPVAFLDSSPRLSGKKALGYHVLPPDTVLGDPNIVRNTFFVLASGHYENEIANICQRAGLRPNKDFISARDLSPLDPSVDISGLCNLRCISCPRGNLREQGSHGFMSAATYNRVIDKLLSEIPLMGNMQVYAWGEPLLNPEVAEIIRITNERKVLCAISTNLNLRRDFSGAIQARPDWIKVSASGFGSSYNLTHTGGDWDVFLRNLYRLKEYQDKYHPTMYVELNYHLYRHNLGEDYRQMADLCHDLGFAFRPNWAYLYPLDNVLDYCENRQISQEATQTLDLLLLGIDEGLARARQQSHLRCAEERCFPIAWDLSVRSCGAYFRPMLADNYLEFSMEDILDRREQSGICNRCRQYALHRFTSVYLEESTSADVSQK